MQVSQKLYFHSVYLVYYLYHKQTHSLPLFSFQLNMYCLYVWFNPYLIFKVFLLCVSQLQTFNAEYITLNFRVNYFNNWVEENAYSW